MEDTTIKDVLKTVQDFYRQNDLKSALQTLEAAERDISGGLWHYNMGTIHGKMENWSLARYHFLQSQLEGYTGGELQINLNIVESKLNLTKVEGPITSQDYLLRAGLEAQHGVFTLVGLLFILLATISLWKKSGYKIWLSFLSCALLVFGLNLWVRSLDEFVVIRPQMIQEGPSAIFRSVDELPAGVLLIGKRQENWLKIIYPSRLEGWIKNEGLKELQ